jgi:hypothetical protein
VELPRKGHWTLAGGVTTGHLSHQDHLSPERALEASGIPAEMRSLFGRDSPVVAPPANVLHPSGMFYNSQLELLLNSPKNRPRFLLITDY